MEEAKSEIGDSNHQTVKHIMLKSQKYKMHYELIWSEKFVDSVSNLNNRSFTNIIKKLKGNADEEEKKPEFGEKCLLINKLHKSMSESQIIQKSQKFQENLIEEIEANILTTDFGYRLRLEPCQLSIPSFDGDESLRGLPSNEMDMGGEWNNEPDTQNMFSVNHHMHTVMKKRKKWQHLTEQMQDYLLTLFKMYP